jgi:hypothetical protein
MELDIKIITDLLGTSLVQVLSEPGSLSSDNWKKIQVTLSESLIKKGVLICPYINPLHKTNTLKDVAAIQNRHPKGLADTSKCLQTITGNFSKTLYQIDGLYLGGVQCSHASVHSKGLKGGELGRFNLKSILNSTPRNKTIDCAINIIDYITQTEKLPISELQRTNLNSALAEKKQKPKVMSLQEFTTDDMMEIDNNKKRKNLEDEISRSNENQNGNEINVITNASNANENRIDKIEETLQKIIERNSQLENENTYLKNALKNLENQKKNEKQENNEKKIEKKENNQKKNNLEKNNESNITINEINYEDNAVGKDNEPNNDLELRITMLEKKIDKICSFLFNNQKNNINLKTSTFNENTNNEEKKNLNSYANMVKKSPRFPIQSYTNSFTRSIDEPRRVHIKIYPNSHTRNLNDVDFRKWASKFHFSLGLQDEIFRVKNMGRSMLELYYQPKYEEHIISTLNENQIEILFNFNPVSSLEKNDSQTDSKLISPALQKKKAIDRLAFDYARTRSVGLQACIIRNIPVEDQKKIISRAEEWKITFKEKELAKQSSSSKIPSNDSKESSILPSNLQEINNLDKVKNNQEKNVENIKSDMEFEFSSPILTQEEPKSTTQERSNNDY